MGGKPSKGTPRDRRLKENGGGKKAAAGGKKVRRRPFGRGNAGEGRFPL